MKGNSYGNTRGNLRIWSQVVANYTFLSGGYLLHYGWICKALATSPGIGQGYRYTIKNLINRDRFHTLWINAASLSVVIG